MVDDKEQMHRAIGRFFVEFSQMIHAMDSATAFVIAGGRPMSLAYAALGQRGAMTVVDAYFTLLAEIGYEDWNKADKEVVSKLKEEVKELVRVHRNRYVHDAWFVGWVSHKDGETWPADHRRHTYTPTKEGARMDWNTVTVTDLEAQSDNADRLRILVGNLMGNVVVKASRSGTTEHDPSPSELMEIVDGQVVWSPRCHDDASS
jgi:hypothetical protein